MDHNFSGPSFTLGIEEELMILDGESLALASESERIVDEIGSEEVKPELLQSVLEIATPPRPDTRLAGAELRRLRRQVCDVAGGHGLLIGSAGTHPFSLWEDQRVSAAERYRGLIAELRFVARQEIIFGLHVHVGLDDPEKAIYVANAMRVHIPILVAISANSPYWRGDDTGLASARTPIFRAFPRVGIPPTYTGWDDYAGRIGFMMQSGVIKNYTYLWFDVRPHPDLGTIELRAMDAQTRVEHTLGIAALIQAMAKELAERYERGGELTDYPHEMLDENKWLAARHGLDGEIVDLPSRDRVGTKALAKRLYERLLGHAQDLGSGAEFEALHDLIENGTGATRQRVVYEANSDFVELCRDIVDATAPA